MAHEAEERRAGGSGVLECIIVTPEATVLEAQADFVALPLLDGELGVAPRHSPMIGRLGYGELRVVSGSATQRFYIDGGFVQVADDVVAVLTNRAIPATQLDPEVAAEQLASALARPANSEEQLQQRERLQEQARAQLRVAQHARLA